jgi:hypothetical protein
VTDPALKLSTPNYLKDFSVYLNLPNKITKTNETSQFIELTYNLLFWNTRSANIIGGTLLQG